MTDLRILLVEDSPTQALRLQDMLQRHGYEVEVAASAEAALPVLNRKLPHLLIVDHHLPGLQGMDLCRQVRLHVASLSMPILMLTADESPERQREGLDSGADDFLPKSAAPAELLLRVRNLLRHARRDTEVDVLPAPVFRQARALVAGISRQAARDLDGLLHDEGCLVEHRETGSAALAALAAGGYDCTFVAEQLPDMAGVDFCRRVRAALPEMPALIIVRQGDADLSDGMSDLLGAGIDDLMRLEPSRAPLRARLRAILRRRFLEDQNRRLLAEFRARERRTLLLEAERNAAEARAALADQLRLTNIQLEEANRRLAEQAQITRTITDNIASALVMTDAAGDVTFLNPAARALLAATPAELCDGRLFRRLHMPPVPGHALPGPAKDKPALLDGPGGERTPVSVTIAPLAADDGRPSGAVIQIVDVTEQRLAEERQELMMAELSHRVKNTLATVLSIGTQTRRRHHTLDSFWPAFEGRLRALSATHNLLARHHWEWVRLSEIIAHEVRPYSGQEPDDVRVSGPDVELRPKAALALALVFHELATNAAKYGAFVNPDGFVDISWTLDRRPAGTCLAVTWKERGGPPIATPPSTGFGSVLIRQSLTYELQGSARLDFQADGLLCRMGFPIGDTVRPVLDGSSLTASES
ncbi:response regulator [Oleisolibacter albus]|uniref:response regulator n=1 Tax=Oleisolibacter albus TaxID=2171757 RepID=UPI000DF28442|nr:response regulator [Oleisolibacter albus]